MENIIENPKEADSVEKTEAVEKTEETNLLAKLPPPTAEEVEQLKTMSFEERKFWLNKRTFSLCETESTIGKQVASVLCYPSAELRKVADLVTDFDQYTQNIIDLLINSVYAHRGMGIAATQIGAALRIFIIDCAVQNKNSASDLRIFVNPQILETSKETVRNGEGCLSFPEVYDQVVRPKRIAGKALDREGKEFEFEYNDNIYAVAIQHETDHLNGVTMLDHFGRLAKRNALKKLEKGIKRQSAKPKQFQRRSW